MARVMIRVMARVRVRARVTVRGESHLTSFPYLGLPTAVRGVAGDIASATPRVRFPVVDLIFEVSTGGRRTWDG